MNNKAVATSPSAPKKLNNSDIQPRKMDFSFDPAMPRYWFDNDQFKTILLTALSCTFPEGERSFVRSVRHYQKQLRDPLLREQVKDRAGVGDPGEDLPRRVVVVSDERPERVLGIRSRPVPSADDKADDGVAHPAPLYRRDALFGTDDAETRACNRL